MSSPATSAAAARAAAIASELKEAYIIETIAATMLGFIVVTFAIRMYVRIRMLRQFAAEDWSMVVAFMLSTAQCIVAIIIVQIHVEYVNGRGPPIKVNSELPKWSTGLFALSIVALKISLGFFFLQLFSHKRVQRHAVMALVVLSSITGVAYWAFTCFTCTVLLQAPGTNLDCDVQGPADGVFYAFSSVSIAGDFIFVIMALIMLRAAKIPTPAKALACVLLGGLGLVGGIASIIRFAMLVRPVTAANFRRSVYNVGQWTIIEHTTGIVAANLAMTRPLVIALVKRIQGINWKGSGKGTGSKASKLGTGKAFGVKAGTSGSSGFIQGAQQDDGRPGEKGHRDRDGEAYLLHEIKKEVAVRVDEEAGNLTPARQDSKSNVLDDDLFERGYVYRGRSRYHQ